MDFSFTVRILALNILLPLSLLLLTSEMELMCIYKTLINMY